MGTFHRDRDASAFIDQGDQDSLSSPSKKVASPSKANNVADKEDAALASLRKRMAGPSSAKAGLSTDQDEINRKIYEASKGSKYFENEKRNDERTTRQIEAMLARRNEILSHYPEDGDAWKATERRVDERVLALEGQRDLSRIIVHADMDMFYAAVELKRDPSLRGKAFGVGKGVLVTASYEARKKGCRSGMATHVALALCPELIVVANDMAAYVSASQQVMTIFEHYDPNYAQMSLDEAYLDITPYCEMNDASAEDVVTELRHAVQRETGLTVSVGIAANKMLAKIGSDRGKPNGQFRVSADRNHIIDFMHELPCRKIPGIGRVTERILSSLGVNTCGDVWRHRTMLHLTLGDIDWLLNAYLGIHSNIVEPSKRGERKSVGREHTFRPTNNTAQLKELLQQSAEQVGKDLARLDYRGKCVTLTFKTDTFQRFTRAKTMASYVCKGKDLYEITSKLLDAEIAARGGPFALRLIGVRISSLMDLREPEEGGIKKLFEKARTSPRKRPVEDSRPDSHSSIVDSPSMPGADWESKFDEDIEEALQRSMDDQLHNSKRANDSDDGRFTDTTRHPAHFHTEDPSAVDNICPICGRMIDVADEDKNDVRLVNNLLNEHVDRCLANEGNSEGSSAPPPSRSSCPPAPTRSASPHAHHHPKKKKKSSTLTLDTFFRQPKNQST